MNRLLKSFKYALTGLRAYLFSGGNVPIHLSAYGIILILGFYVGLSRLEWCIINLCAALVLSAEAFNTAIEEIVNFISPEYHIKAGKIKDIAAAAVLLCAIFALVIALIIFLPYLYN